MMEEEEKAVVACLSVAMGKFNPLSVVKGSIEDLCSLCDKEIYVSPSTQNLLKSKPDISLICLDCLKQQIQERRDDEEIIQLGVVPGFQEEIRQHLKDNFE